MRLIKRFSLGISVSKVHAKPFGKSGWLVAATIYRWPIARLPARGFLTPLVNLPEIFKHPLSVGLGVFGNLWNCWQRVLDNLYRHLQEVTPKERSKERAILAGSSEEKL
jgi:hypothetical protein